MQCRATTARRPFLASAAASVLPVLAAPSLASAKAEDAPVDLKSILGDVQDGIAAKEAKAAEEAKLEAELAAMPVADRIKYERKQAAMANKAAMDEAALCVRVKIGTFRRRWPRRASRTAVLIANSFAGDPQN